MWQVLSIFLQASGILFVLWITLGWLVLGGERGGMCVRTCHAGEVARAESYVRSCSWLREMGILRMRILLVDIGLSADEHDRLMDFISNRKGVMLCGERELSQILEKEAREHGRTGSAAGNCGGGRI